MSVSVASCKTRDWRRGDIRLNIRAIQPSLKFPNEGIQCMLFPKSSEAYATDGQGGISLVVKRQFSKLKLGVRFPHPAQLERRQYCAYIQADVSASPIFRSTTCGSRAHRRRLLFSPQPPTGGGRG